MEPQDSYDTIAVFNTQTMREGQKQKARITAATIVNALILSKLFKEKPKDN